MKKALFFIALFGLTFSYKASYSWGNQGHKIVGEIAYRYLDAATRDSVKKYLGEMNFQDAATWMDDVRKDTSLNYMKPWHYINVEKDKTYVKSANEDIINELNKVIEDLLKNRLTKEQVNLNIKILFHLVGDLHQPLHVGYSVDKGGNSVDVKFLGKKTNLHKVWDTEIITEMKITVESCMSRASKYSKKKTKKIQKIDVLKWMDESRALLINAYDVKEGSIDQAYVDKNTPLVEERLIFAGMRLASVLKETFKAPKS